MRKLFFAGFLLFTVFSCSESKKNNRTHSEEMAKVDSLVALKMEEITRLAAEDFDIRKSIEVKAKADSIVKAYFEGKTNP